MSAIVGLLTLCCLVMAFFAILTLHPRLPAQHRDEDTVISVRLSVGIIATLSALVLGLILSSVKNNYDTVQKDIKSFGLELTALDASLRSYGPDANKARQELVGYTRSIIAHSWPTADQPEIATNELGRGRMTALERAIADLPQTQPEQVFFASQAAQDVRSIVKRRQAIISEDTAYLSPVFTVILIIWLALLFGSLGYCVPRNPIVIGTTLLAAATVASAVFLMLELDDAFTGLIAVSEQPLIAALQTMQYP